MPRLSTTLIALSFSMAAPLASCSEASDGSSSEAGGGEGGHAGAGSDAHGVEPPRRVVAYLPTYRNMDPTRIDFPSLTHLCIAFANPTGDGSASDFEVSARDKIGPLVEAAHAAGVRVLASIAGGTQETGALVAEQITAERREAYIEGLLKLLSDYQLDGIDVDIEGEHVTETYEPFVLALRSALPENKLLTSAVATWNGAAFSDEALGAYDFINVMAYDHCGWSVEACEHSSLPAVLDELDYWTEERRYPREKTVLGVPFYGWCWGCAEKQTALTWFQILRDYPEALTEDWIEKDGVQISLNSAKTIREKARLAQAYGGIMAWELGQDASGDDSLFSVIAEVAASSPKD